MGEKINKKGGGEHFRGVKTKQPETEQREIFRWVRDCRLFFFSQLPLSSSLLQDWTVEPNFLHWPAIRDWAERLWAQDPEPRHPFQYYNLIGAIKRLRSLDSESEDQKLVQEHFIWSFCTTSQESEAHKEKKKQQLSSAESLWLFPSLHCS